MLPARYDDDDDDVHSPITKTIRRFSVISGHTLAGSCSFAEMQSEYITAPVDWEDDLWKKNVIKSNKKFAN